MAQGDITVYNNFKEALLNNVAPDLSAVGTVVRVMLVSGYTPDIDVHDNVDDVSANEISGTGYTAEGEAIANKTVTQDDTDDEAVFNGDDVVWTGLDAGTPSHGIIYVDTGTPGTSLLIAYIELGVASNGQDYTIQWNAEGILNLV